MFGSRRPQSPDKPQGGKHDPPPNPDDRYVPAGSIQINLVDSEGRPTTVLLSRRAARDLADQIFQVLTAAGVKGGAK